MAGSILTPNLIWKNFSVNTEFYPTIVNEQKVGDIIYTRLKFNGRRLKDGVVKIFATMAKSVQQGFGPAVLLFNDLTSSDNDDLIKMLVESGFSVLSVDVAGETAGKKYYTEYPKSLSHANYENSKNVLYTVENGVQDTCWYEWACVGRYALEYLKSLPEITKVGGIGIGDAATVLWEVAGSTNLLDCAVFAFNAGWIGYRGIDKFGGMVEPQFSDNMYKFIAGVEPQAYAMHVKCPTLVLCATNSKKFDADRAFDTISRIDNGVYSAINYSVGCRNSVNSSAVNTANLFLENFLLREDNKAKELPSDVDIKCELDGGKAIVTVKAEERNLSKVELCVSEETVDPAKRCWSRTTKFVRKTDDGYVFEYMPFSKSETVMFFAQCEYKNGYTVGSNVIAKKFKESDVAFSYKSNIIYSSRLEEAESVFAPATEDEQINLKNKGKVSVQKGAKGIMGVRSDGGLLTFKINAKKDKPSDNAMLMFDVYCKQKNLLTVRLISDYFGQKIEYIGWITVLGGEVWQNVKMELSRFKTEEGMPLKSYAKIEALEFRVEEGGAPLINNALWV